VIIAQQYVGYGRVVYEAMYVTGWEVRTQIGGGGFGLARVVPPGHVLLHLMTVLAFALLTMKNNSRLTTALLNAQFLFLALGGLLTYTRAQWLATALALGAIVVLLPRRSVFEGLKPLLGAGVALLLFAGVSAASQAGGSEFLALLSQRALSVTEPDATLATESLQWRAYENEQALRAISEHPVLGLGLGASYREPAVDRSEAEQVNWGLTRFVHNGYLYLTVKMGLPAPALFLLFVCGFLVLGWQAFGRMADGVHKRLLLGVLASFVGLLQWLLTQPHVFFAESTATIGLMVGLAITLGRLGRTNTTPSPILDGGY
jgi:O-antigen ligase